jgi:exoribonuclease R
VRTKSAYATSFGHGTPSAFAVRRSRASQYEAGIVSVIEAAVLAGSIGEIFDAVVVEIDEHDGAGVVQLREPAVAARCDGDDLPLGERVKVRLVLADVMKRQVRFTLVG